MFSFRLAIPSSPILFGPWPLLRSLWVAGENDRKHFGRRGNLLGPGGVFRVISVVRDFFCLFGP